MTTRAIGDTSVLDNAAVQGLSGTPDSLAYKVGEIERHFHSYERWFETAAAPNGEIHVADPIGDNGGTAFQIDAGNLDWGAWVQILGSSDTPNIGGSAYYNTHRIYITAVERINSIYLLQVSFGTSGAAGLAAGTYLSLPYKTSKAGGEEIPIGIQNRRQAVGTKAWARCKCIGENTATLNFFFGIHEYEG